MTLSYLESLSIQPLSTEFMLRFQDLFFRAAKNLKTAFEANNIVPDFFEVFTPTVDDIRLIARRVSDNTGRIVFLLMCEKSFSSIMIDVF